jgi:hypothetical protein
MATRTRKTTKAVATRAKKAMGKARRTTRKLAKAARTQAGKAVKKTKATARKVAKKVKSSRKAKVALAITGVAAAAAAGLAVRRARRGK